MKKKLDRKRISLTQLHERKYLKKIAEEFLEYLKIYPKQNIITTSATKKEVPDQYNSSSARRICKALLKCLK